MPQIQSGVFCCPGNDPAHKLRPDYHSSVENQGMVLDAQENVSLKQSPHRSRPPRSPNSTGLLEA